MAESELKLLSDGKTGSGCFITSAVCESFGFKDDCYELELFRKFRDEWLVNETDGKALIQEYYLIAPKIVEQINSKDNAKEIYKKIWYDYLNQCLIEIQQRNNQKSKEIYWNMVIKLKELFLG